MLSFQLPFCDYLSNEMAVLIVEQNLEMALRIATKVYVMDRGGGRAQRDC
jgi:ABC-type branched-subunit amino acid transport system ATPase component